MVRRGPYASRPLQTLARSLSLLFALLILLFLNHDIALASAGDGRSRSDKDIAAIGHRDLAGGKKHLGNWYLLDQEKDLGTRYSAQIERSCKVLDDAAITRYVNQIADRIARNSDARIPITVRLVDSEHVEAFTLPGGYQYITSGLLLQLDSEGELASVLARGIAHTALRSNTRLMTRAKWAEIGTIPLVYTGWSVPSAGASSVAASMSVLSFNRKYQLDADYFGVQYVYKAGYRAESFVSLVQRLWPASRTSAAISPFPPTRERLKLLRKEISDLLPHRDSEVASTPEFGDFKQRVRSWRRDEPRVTPNAEELRLQY
ncbi:MAG TPA: M48 family metalloprotease [Terriglobales bacterium]|jgi:predicted Zn-dependent protease